MEVSGRKMDGLRALRVLKGKYCCLRTMDSEMAEAIKVYFIRDRSQPFKKYKGQKLVNICKNRDRTCPKVSMSLLNKVVKPHNGPWAVLVLNGTSHNVIQDAIGFSVFGLDGFPTGFLVDWWKR